MTRFVHGGLVLAGVVICLTAGCAVQHPPGKGKLTLLREKTTQRHYWLYLPEEYVAQHQGGAKTPVHPATQNGRWPLVVSLHGMKPFDNCLPQAQEWQQESDRYGFIVIAPQLMTSDLFMKFPLRNANHSYVRGDERAVVDITREVLDALPVDEKRVLSTSWGSGGYLAHYLVNRHPGLFSCLAVRQSNFSADVLEPRQVKRYRDLPIGIFWTRSDPATCQAESRKAVSWYQQQGFRDISWAVFAGTGHERMPQTAAALFALQCKIKPNQPAKFAKLFEAHGRIRQAIAHATRAAPRAAIPVRPARLD